MVEGWVKLECSTAQYDDKGVRHAILKVNDLVYRLFQDEFT